MPSRIQSDFIYSRFEPTLDTDNSSPLASYDCALSSFHIMPAVNTQCYCDLNNKASFICANTRDNCL